VLDTARFGLEGGPIFLPGEPVRVGVAPELLGSGMPLDVLLLAHTNPPGQQWQVVSVVPQVPNELSVSVYPSTGITPGGEGPATIRVTNTEAATATAVALVGDVTGGEIADVTTDVGSCTGGASIACDLGDLAPGVTVDVSVTLRHIGPGDAMSLTASVGAEVKCEANTADNTATASIGVKEVEPFPPGPSGFGPDLVPSGGCGCVAAGESEPGSSGWWGLSLLGLVLLRRLKRSGTGTGAGGKR
jgi:MYXO-CTERM domain-containing protein